MPPDPLDYQSPLDPATEPPTTPPPINRPYLVALVLVFLAVIAAGIWVLRSCAGFGPFP